MGAVGCWWRDAVDDDVASAMGGMMVRDGGG